MPWKMLNTYLAGIIHYKVLIALLPITCLQYSNKCVSNKSHNWHSTYLIRPLSTSAVFVLKANYFLINKRSNAHVIWRWGAVHETTVAMERNKRERVCVCVWWGGVWVHERWHVLPRRCAYLSSTPRAGAKLPASSVSTILFGIIS